MSVTKNLDHKDKLNGPYTMKIKDTSDPMVVLVSFKGRKSDSLQYTVENILSEEDEVGEQEILGKDLNAVGTYSEVITGDLETVDNNDIGEVTIEFHVKGQIITIPSPNVFSSVEDAKSNIEIRNKNWKENGTITYPFAKAPTS